MFRKICTFIFILVSKFKLICSWGFDFFFLLNILLFDMLVSNSTYPLQTHNKAINIPSQFSFSLPFPSHQFYFFYSVTTQNIYCFNIILLRTSALLCSLRSAVKHITSWSSCQRAWSHLLARESSSSSRYIRKRNCAVLHFQKWALGPGWCTMS